MRPLGEVGVSHVTVSEDEVLVTSETSPMPDGTVCVCVCVCVRVCVCAVLCYVCKQMHNNFTNFLVESW